MVKRYNEYVNGFSINALGFAGYLLATEFSQLAWLERKGPEHLLKNVVSPI